MTDETSIVPERRHLNLTRGERADLSEQRQIELAVSYFLDLEQDRTVRQIAEEMGLSVSALKRLTQKPEFQSVYDEALMGLGHHPRLQALTASLPELASLSYRAMRDVLTGPRVAATAKVAAVKLLWDTLGLGDMRADEDPAPLNNFMQAHGVNVQGEGNTINVINVPIPDEYRAAFLRFAGVQQPETVDAIAEDIPEPSK